MDQISKLSKAERNFLVNTTLTEWKPDGKNFETYTEELSFMKHLVLRLNSRLITRQLGPASEEKLEYFICLSEVIILEVDYYTVNHAPTALMAKFALDKCIEKKKEIALSIKIDKKLKVDNLISSLTQGKYISKI